jgi:hypothetical protein
MCPPFGKRESLTKLRFYASVLEPDLTPEYPQMEDGLHQMKLLDAVLASSQIEKIRGDRSNLGRADGERSVESILQT